MAAINYSLAFLVLCGLLSDTYSLPLKRLTRSTSHIKKIREGDPIELHCTASGSTPPIIHWRFNSKYVQQSRDDESMSCMEAPEFHGGPEYTTWTTGRLVVHNARRENSGKYTCVAETAQEKQTESFSIEVVENEDLKVAEPKEDQLRIDQISTQIYQNENEPLYAVCRATQGSNRPAPTVSWYLGSTELTKHNSRYGIKLHENGDLEVSRATSDFHWMSNSLECRATGEDSQVVSESVWVYMMINDD